MKRRAFSLSELCVAMGAATILFTSAFTILSSTLSSYRKTDVKLDNAEKSSLALRKITEEIRSAVTITVANDGSTVTYQLPKYYGVEDTTTGEKEVVVPMQGDGVTRSLSLAEYKLIYSPGDGTTKALIRGVSPVDLEPGTPTYNTSYPYFQLTTVGSTKALRVMLVVFQNTSGGRQYSRMATTVLLRNVQ